MIKENNKTLNDSMTITDFTIDNYKKCINLAKEKYEFIDYGQINQKEKFILWRHDCDCSLNRALELAKIENDLKIKSTYFIYIHSSFYNVFEKNQSKIIYDILSLGHDMGLHFDADYYGINNVNDLNIKIKYETNLLENIFNKKIKAFSFHYPSDWLFECEEERYGDLINCYSKNFKEEIGYVSDSNGYWRFHPLQSILEKGIYKELQVLTHPVWWQKTPMLPRERIMRAINGRSKYVANTYDSFLESNNRINLKD